MLEEKRFSHRKINHLVNALSKAGFCENGHLGMALQKFLRSNDKMKILRVVGAFRIISPSFSKKIPAGTDFITEEVRNQVERFMEINLPINIPQGPTDESLMKPYELRGGQERR